MFHEKLIRKREAQAQMANSPVVIPGTQQSQGQVLSPNHRAEGFEPRTPTTLESVRQWAISKATIGHLLVLALPSSDPKFHPGPQNLPNETLI